VVAVLGAAILGFAVVDGPKSAFSAGSLSAAEFVGSEACAECHQAEARLWKTSQHRAAMQHASEGTVLGDFNDAAFTYFGLRSRFFRKDGKFLIETDGVDGTPTVFEIKYTFGVDPLQQYLVEFPGGRLQALPLAWDSRPNDKGGQRWLHLSPEEEIKHDDALHWTKGNQNWNFMCAECHSTGVRKNYDVEADRFATRWAEISVGCEACHGEGSRHLAWAQERRRWLPFGRQEDASKGLLVRFDERRDVAWPIDPKSATGRRSLAAAGLRKEVETCGLCHARRASIHEHWIPGQPLSQTHIVEALARNTYHVDGQIRDVEEPYNYTPFKQSKMFAAGVTCSDCHEPHGARLRSAGDGVCLQCHAPDRFADAKHHHHAEGDRAPGCISCHMPARTFMVVDRRHDHAFRIPRPDVSLALGTPNACNDCHRDKSPQWAARAIEQWFGPDRKGFQSYGPAFHAARTDQADAATLLAAIAGDRQIPAVARASALTELSSHVTPESVALAKSALADSDPMVRIGALDLLENIPSRQIWPWIAPLLSDPVRGVRIKAVTLLASVPAADQPAPDRTRFDQAAAEFVSAQRANAERPESRSALGAFLAQRGLIIEAEAEFKAALRLDPRYPMAAINLADLYRRSYRDSDGETVLRTALALSPREPGLHHALGLTLIRLKRSGDAIAALRQATELEPGNPRFTYVFAVALHSSGQRTEALAVLREVLQRHPNDRNILSALIAFNREAGDPKAALGYAERLAVINPDDPDLQQLIRDLSEIIDARPRSP